ncbi:hypothetical protein HanOQP8_Chr03g0110001 [Helianthus annuus]|nr:hypothetical protein HanOQP8_Chr03g0110001 [Helianthus annuus]
MLCLLYAIRFSLVFELVKGSFGGGDNGGGGDRWWRWWRLMVLEVVMDGGCFFVEEIQRERCRRRSGGIYFL